ncbi:uncharacterized protein AMSG_02313 [Thecamonas trahens ATCC 50062]|uniref:c-Myc-binding protein n=1 Tax=Thecamonas trahens ATCC 50062 TaxID=461836 RepID=A0A0L0DVZ0_THETB|nr:hypothetical protein AMSG_02313 [Thecamonas trahens ATCC 50062]KNC56342.1 hypothetical protein AMSG_02313 [Thecamonas trahens ATCC 50062]|eukprot:XP_013760859.1 hypothetical protein AMSG_02313 [Thecamonas trahens ATCC 50062]
MAYQERGGVIDALTKVLVLLYEEPDKPPHALDWIRSQLGAPAGVDVEAIRRDNKQLADQVKELQAENQNLLNRLRELEVQHDDGIDDY